KTVLATFTCEEDKSLWHQYCSYVNLNDLHAVVRKAHVTGLGLHSKCKPCLACKLNHHPIPRFASRKFISIALVHTDLKDHLPVATPEEYCTG
ncbi:hypothetical protein BC628DRAFT_1326586, partial [Trametes gibbosa]